MNPPALKALLLENIHPGARSHLESLGWEVELLNRALGSDELAERLASGVNLLGIRSQTQVNDAALSAAADLLALGAFCIGTNQIDLSAASCEGVAVFNAPFSNTRSVVELVVAEIISLTRRLSEKDRAMHSGEWDKTATGAHEVRGRRLGIVGYGNIGTQLSVLAESLGLSVFFYDTADRLALGNARRCDTLDELLESVDIVTLHVDGRTDNRDFFGDKEFTRMNRGSIFLNLSRGFVVDHLSLRDHILAGHISGAAVDVFPTEPKASGQGFTSELQGLANVILTPHIGGSTEEAQVDIGRFVAHKLSEYVRHGTTSLSVNLPGVELPHRSGVHGVAHIHRNVPGALAKITSIMAQHHINIESQALDTKGDIGYVLLDVANDVTAEMMAQLSSMDEAIRVRCM